MNLLHRRLCRSAYWKQIVKTQALPWALEGLKLGADVLEVGPGYGASTELLHSLCERLTCVEVDCRIARYLRQHIPAANVTVLCEDATAMPFPDGEFDGAVCFMMLHHLPSAAGQDRLLAEVERVLRPGGVFAGIDSVASRSLRFLHLFDTLNTVEPGAFPDRLKAAGFEDVQVDVSRYAFRFRARKPGHAPRSQRQPASTVAAALQTAGTT